MMLARVLKLLHEVGSVGVVGSLVACLVLAAAAPTESLAEFAAVRHASAELGRLILVPSLALVIVSGLLSIAATNAFKNAGWAWVKAALGLLMFEGTLLTVQGSLHRAAELSALAARGAAGGEVALAEVLRTEWYGVWTMIALSAANFALAIWRPRLTLRRASSA